MQWDALIGTRTNWLFRWHLWADCVSDTHERIAFLFCVYLPAKYWTCRCCCFRCFVWLWCFVVVVRQDNPLALSLRVGFIFWDAVSCPKHSNTCHHVCLQLICSIWSLNSHSLCSPLIFMSLLPPSFSTRIYCCPTYVTQSVKLTKPLKCAADKKPFQIFCHFLCPAYWMSMLLCSTPSKTNVSSCNGSSSHFSVSSNVPLHHLSFLFFHFFLPMSLLLSLSPSVFISLYKSVLFWSSACSNKLCLYWALMCLVWNWP